MLCSGVPLVLLVAVVLVPAQGCPRECNCFSKEERHHSVCRTTNITATVSKLPAHTTHLLIDDIREFAEEFEPDFSHLPNLTGLAFAYSGPYTVSRVKLDRGSFAVPSKMERFLSSMRIDFPPDLFSDMPLMEWMTLTNTAVTWDIFPSLMNESLCKMQNLTRLNLSGFTVEYGTSKWQQHFRPNQVFAGCELESLRELVLGNNDISIFEAEFYKPFPNLTILDLSFNQLFRTDYFARSNGMYMILRLALLNQMHTIDIGHQIRKMPLGSPRFEQLTETINIPLPRQICNFSETMFLVCIQDCPWPPGTDT
jgi:Leucine-rich repeat (LRR) protein